MPSFSLISFSIFLNFSIWFVTIVNFLYCFDNIFIISINKSVISFAVIAISVSAFIICFLFIIYSKISKIKYFSSHFPSNIFMSFALNKFINFSHVISSLSITTLFVSFNNNLFTNFRVFFPFSKSMYILILSFSNCIFLPIILCLSIFSI